MDTANTEPIEPYLERLWTLGGTDLLLTAASPALGRIDGRLGPLLDDVKLGTPEVHALVSAVLGDVLTARLEQQRELDFGVAWGGRARLRGNAFYQRGGVALALRIIPSRIPTFADLGLPPIVEEWARLPRGFVLVTGPTGSGKSTTLASLIDYINTHRAVHIVTIEDPIEYVHENKLAAVNQREVGQDTHSFPNALRAVLREDPDVLLVGEMRDPESIQAALTVAETGHLVFATLHSNDTAQTLDRIVDVFPGEQQNQIRLQLAHTLSGVLSQQLLPRIGGGRVAAFEVLVGTSAARNLIREGKTRQIRNAVSTGSRDGMQTLEDSLSDLVGQGVITYDDAVSWSSHPKDIRAPLPAYGVPPAR